MNNSNKVVKSVAFNKKNPEEKQLLDSVKRKNFSKYVKKLMLEDYIKKMNEKAEQSIQQYNSSYQEEDSYTSPQSNTYTHNQQNPPMLSSSEQLSQLKRKKDWQ